MIDEEALYNMAAEISDQGDFTSAFQLFMEGAERGYGPAMTRVAVMYFQGEGTVWDWDQSIAWDLKAIDQGEDTSLHNLAITYRAKGEITKAKLFFEKSLAKGDFESALDLAKLYMVSEKEQDRVLSYLELVLTADATYITEYGVEEAQRLRADIMSSKN